MEKEKLCQKILKDLNKSDVGVKVSQDIKGNYYSYINNCIYLNGKQIGNNEEIAKENVVIAHESIHATQSKKIHILNVILSNLELILFLMFCIIAVVCKSVLVLKIIYMFTGILAICVRNMLEIRAMINSFNLDSKYSNNEMKEIIEKDNHKFKYILPLGMLSYSWFRILRVILVIFV